MLVLRDFARYFPVKLHYAKNTLYLVCISVFTGVPEAFA